MHPSTAPNALQRFAPFAATLLVALAASLGVVAVRAQTPAATPPPAQELEPADTAAPDTAAPDTGRGTLPRPTYQVWLDARLDDDGVIHGTERLSWRNTTRSPVSDLQFHLYLNAFANNRSTFMRESGGQLRGDDFDQKGWGYIEIHSIELTGGGDLKPGEEFVAPDDGNMDDRTVVRYPLPEPLPPGGRVEVTIEFESRLPDIFARTGKHGDYVLAGQWYPKIAVFEDSGFHGRQSAGWNAHQFHANSEFYADFGDYEVSLTLPQRYAEKIGATGRRQEAGGDVTLGMPEQPAGGDEEGAAETVTVHYSQRGVHDFAWTASPDFLVLTERFDPATDVPEATRREWADTLGVSEEELALTPVEIELYLQPAHRDQAERYFSSAKAAIRGYGIRLGAYPYDTLTMVDPAWGAMGSGGMEYPTFITLATHPMLGMRPFTGILAPELVTIHEFGHQYFQGMIANNEFEEAWIDEGINSYYEMDVMEDEYSHSIRLPGLFAMTSFESNRASIAGGDYSDTIAQPAWSYMSDGRYGRNSYPRPAITLRHLEGLLGAKTFHRSMRNFFQRYQFQHPSTKDFERAIEEASGEDLGWFFSQALHSTRALDYSVRRLRNRHIRDPAGFFWENGERVELGAEDDDASSEDGGDGGDEASDEDGEKKAKRWESEVVVYREGEFIHPVTIEFRFDDGRVERREWSGQRRWAKWTFRGSAKLASAEVDPDRWMALDVDRLNNSRRDDADKAPALGFATDALYWLQSLFHAVALFS